MPNHPLAEVFGFPIDNRSRNATRYRRYKLCPFNNKSPNCTKDKADDPLGVCSIFHGNDIVITCPIRFRQDWVIAEDAAAFFFPSDTTWTSLTEVPLHDNEGKAAGNIDLVLVAYDERGRVIDFGALEVQAVYISGNIRRPFEYYMENPLNRGQMDWTRERNYPRPDYLSSSRKRLAPQLLFKGGILNAWNKRIAVAVSRPFFQALPPLPEVTVKEAEIAWLIYDLRYDKRQNRYVLALFKTVYTRFESSLSRLTTAEAGAEQDFIQLLQARLADKLEHDIGPDTSTLDAPF